jgi:ribonuclease BN (tRNA processing enzyme)
MMSGHDIPPVSSPEDVEALLTGGVPMGRWKEGQLFDGISPTPGLKSAANWFPKTEPLGPDELRIIFMGTSPMIRPGQANTSVFVQLGNGENFVFDIGEGCLANYVAGGFSLNELDKVFLTHLHVDHFNALPYLYMFGGWSGRWHNPLQVYGPSGRNPEDGTAYMIEGMKQMCHWHRDAFSIFPVGQAWDIDVHEYDFRDNGGIIYDKDGVIVRHWQRSHAKDGASGYRLDWNGLSVVWTGDGRPNHNDVEWAKGCDVYITETQAALMAISSGVAGVPPVIGRYTIDNHHTPAYAAGYMANLIEPRLLMTTHMAFDPYQNDETVVEIREHWKGPFHLGAPDGIVVNVTKDAIWVREGILPDYPNNRSPQQDFSNGHFIIPAPNTSREEIQHHGIRDSEVDPAEYYPEGYQPELLEQWPIDTALVVPIEDAPPSLIDGMGENWRFKQAYKAEMERRASEAKS